MTFIQVHIHVHVFTLKSDTSIVLQMILKERMWLRNLNNGLVAETKVAFKNLLEIRHETFLMHLNDKHCLLMLCVP